MIAVVLALLTALVAGLPIAVVLDRSGRPARLVGGALLFGIALFALSLYLLSLLQIEWSLIAALVPALAVSSAFALCMNRSTRTPLELPPALPMDRAAAFGIDCVTLLLVVGEGILATIAPLWEWDFWAIWGLKAKVFWLNGGIDWRFLTLPSNEFIHPDYPLLLPLSLDYLTLALGRWDERVLGLLFTAMAGAALLVVRDLFAAELRARSAAAIATLAVASIVLSAPLGLGEGPLIVYSSIGILFVRRALAGGSGAEMRLAAVYLGLGGLVKNEGVALTAGAVIAALVISRSSGRKLLQLWPAAALFMTWFIPRALLRLPTDLFSGETLGDRTLRKLLSVGDLFSAFAQNPPAYPWFWIAILCGAIYAGREFWSAERFVILVVSLQILFYVGTYITGPHEFLWHVTHSWRRLVVHVAVPIAFVVLAHLLTIVEWRTTPEEASA